MFAIHEKCGFKDCEEEHYAKNLCRRHYNIITNNRHKCRIAECNNYSQQVYCGKHRQQFKQELEEAQKIAKKKLKEMEYEIISKTFNLKKPPTRQYLYRLKLRLRGRCPECGGKRKLYTKSLCKKCHSIANKKRKLKKKLIKTTPCQAIRLFCKTKCLKRPKLIRKCQDFNCPIRSFRLGKNPNRFHVNQRNERRIDENDSICRLFREKSKQSC